ncbi:MAG: YhbY family RNA-binding protein [Nanobdellota archaeon]
MEFKTLKKKAKEIKPLVRVGKSGVTNSLIEEINKHLKKNQLVKVKFLKSSLNETTLENNITNIAKNTKSEIILKIGLSAVFFKAKRK